MQDTQAGADVHIPDSAEDNASGNIRAIKRQKFHTLRSLDIPQCFVQEQVEGARRVELGIFGPASAPHMPGDLRRVSRVQGEADEAQVR
ncbi:hypothetical protein Axy21_031 [Achromobacter phage vB_AxyP_19-32_Axy21]|uniref:Uncharacterized protein n=1 Tax=Achromobacter phage vB_AxyP_19-32_Axy21 TaxID=2591045 RepID=A0A514CVT0_9CAUD|nr:hypothetical protein Axy21_031 [Achromobacter phage vB_AxyP_19-32_Axy21]